MLFRFGKIDSPLCPFCKMIEETPLHLFYNCIKTKGWGGGGGGCSSGFLQGFFFVLFNLFNFSY